MVVKSSKWKYPPKNSFRCWARLCSSTGSTVYEYNFSCSAILNRIKQRKKDENVEERYGMYSTVVEHNTNTFIRSAYLYNVHTHKHYIRHEHIFYSFQCKCAIFEQWRTVNKCCCCFDLIDAISIRNIVIQIDSGMNVRLPVHNGHCV